MPRRWTPGWHRNYITGVLNLIDADGLPRTDHWSPGEQVDPPDHDLAAIQTPPARVSPSLQAILHKATEGADLAEAEVVRLFQARGDDFAAVARAADGLRASVNGDTVSFVVNRNINYTNICYFKCQFCAFSKGKLSENLRGRPYDLSHEEIQRRTREAWSRGGTEVCMQGGIHPEYTGATYIEILQAVKAAAPDMHVHAFSPLEVWQGAATLGLGLETYLGRLREAGLGTLPGTAAEILDDEVRQVICADKINTAQWLEVMAAAHALGFKTTATIMYGHVERPEHWARHLLRIRNLQKETGGFTEFVPLPFVHMEAPMYLKGRARKGADLSRSHPDALRRPACPAPPHRQHPGQLGKDGPCGASGLPQRRLQRPRRYPDEREHQPRRRHQPWAGNIAATDGRHDPSRWPHPAPAHDNL